jgi:hypothetical protein
MNVTGALLLPKKKINNNKEPKWHIKKVRVQPRITVIQRDVV